jgi:uncharacterized protein (DUF488 family)
MFTIGHSIHPIDEFLSLLQAHGVRVLVDVRAIPRSRRNPQFNRETLPASLERAGIRYVHMPGLGGLRRPRPDSENVGWRNAAFRGFADYMQTPEFVEHLETLLAIGEEAPTVIMCAEAVPWRCHRSLIADACAVRGVEVAHIMTRATATPHTITRWAKVDGTTIHYHNAMESEKS